MRDKVAIVGTHDRTRGLAPWNSDEYDLWLFNEVVPHPWVKGRCDALFQMHLPAIYRNPRNRNDMNHWNWLQGQHIFPIYMQDVDLAIPASVKYPLDEICDELLGNFRFADGDRIVFFTNTISYAIALAVHLKYKEIHIYGVEMESNTEYTYQRFNVTFWTGLALGRGITVVQHCGQGIYQVPKYGYDGTPDIPPEEFIYDLGELEGAADKLDAEMQEAQLYSDDLLAGGDPAFKDAWRNTLDIAGYAALMRGIANEARRYHEKATAMIEANGEAPIVRQEYEIGAAKNRMLAEQYMGLYNFESGRAFCAWEDWANTKDHAHLDRFKDYAEKQLHNKRMAGDAEGRYRANTAYQREVDERIKALGGNKALDAMRGSG